MELLDCPLVTTAAGKGLLPHEHPANLGTSLHHAGVQRLVADADVVLAVGTELGETDFYYALKLELRGRLIRIDIDPHKLCDHYAAELPIWADAQASLAGAAQGAAARALARHPPPRAAWRRLRAEIEGALDAKARGIGRARSTPSALRCRRDGAVFTDMTQIAYFGNYAFPVDAPRRWFHPSGYGTLGLRCRPPSAPRSRARRAPSLALAGDFGLQFTLGELMTAVEAQSEPARDRVEQLGPRVRSATT